MKITKSELRSLIAEELQSTLQEMSMMSGPYSFAGAGGYTYTERDDGGFNFVDAAGNAGVARAGSAAANSIAAERDTGTSLYTAPQDDFDGIMTGPTPAQAGLFTDKLGNVTGRMPDVLPAPTAGDYYQAAGADLTKPIPGGLMGDVGPEAAYQGSGMTAFQGRGRRRQARKALKGGGMTGGQARQAVRDAAKAGRERGDKNLLIPDAMMQEGVNIDSLVNAVIAELSK